MAASCFADRISRLAELTAEERAALGRLEERERHLKRGAVLQRENDAANDVYIVTKGAMMSYILLDDGSRQILRFLFPGDMAGSTALAFNEAAETIAAMTDCTVSPFDRSALARVMIEHPRLGALIFVYHQIDRVMLIDRLAALGRASGKARVAAMLLEVRDRLRRADPSIDTTFAIGLTQEEIGDATGLTAVHVNRMLRELENDGLITRSNGRLTFNDEARLARIGNYIDRNAKIDLGWIPAPR